MDKTLYEAPQPGLWLGRIDKPVTAASLRWHQNLQFWDLGKTQNLKTKKTNKNFAILGFCCDEGVRRNQGRTGAKEGPDAIRRVLANLPMPESEHPIQFFDAGNVVCRQKNLEAAQDALAVAVQKILRQNCFPIVLGGGHETAWGHYAGLKPMLSPQHFGIVNVDAHFDLRPFESGGHSGSPFLQMAFDRKKNRRNFSYFCLGLQKSANTAALFQTADAWGVEWILADDIHRADFKNSRKTLQKFLQKQKQIYLTICLDAFAAAFAPGVSAPQALGILPGQILPYLDLICASGKVVSFDIVEMAPKYDQNQITAKLAAQMVFGVVNRLAGIKKP